MYLRQLNSLVTDEIEQFFQTSQKWNLASTLSKGGSVIFPHTLARTCGDQTAAVVRGCLDVGASRVIGLGLIHSVKGTRTVDFRKKMIAREEAAKESCWGIFGPHFPGDPLWKNEHSLLNFKFLWDYEVKKRNLKNPPELILVYPCLVNGAPEILPHIQQLKRYLPDSVVVMTTDFCHHGKAYRTADDLILPISSDAKQYALETTLQGLKIFEHPDYDQYFDYSIKNISDGADPGQVLMYLKGAFRSEVLDIRLVDTAHLYKGDPSPSWVAASLIEMTVIG